MSIILWPKKVSLLGRSLTQIFFDYLDFGIHCNENRFEIALKYYYFERIKQFFKKSSIDKFRFAEANQI